MREEKLMLRTIQIGSCISVQGLFESHTADGRIIVRDGNRLYEGQPVASKPREASMKLVDRIPRSTALDWTFQ